MAETPADSDALVKKEPEAPQRDPVTGRSTSTIVLVSALLLMAVLGWALYDEVYGQRPWKSMQREFVARYNRYLRRLKRTGTASEKEVKQSPEYQQLVAEAEAAKRAADPEVREIDRRIRQINEQLAAITDPFQNKRGYITVVNYQIETADESDKTDLRRSVEEQRSEAVTVETPTEDGKTRKEKLNYAQLEERFNGLKDEKARLLARRAEVLKPYDEADDKREAYLKENVTGLTEQQINLLLERNENFDFSMRQINVLEHDIVDRCETCHLGVRETTVLTPANMRRPRRRPDALARAFTSHPSKELLQIHDPDRFGCASCHGGNGRATTSVVKAHGKNPFWLHPLHEREHMEAGCQQCHTSDRVLEFAPTLNRGKDLFQERGCVGCHRYEGFDRETDALTNSRQLVKQLEEQRTANDREARIAVEESGKATDDAQAQKLLQRAEALRVTNSQLDARIEQLNTQARYLMQDQKKVGPNLKDVRLKLKKEWIPEWLRDPQGFRPGTKMPTFWYLNPGHELAKKHAGQADNERKAISAYLWQASFDGRAPEQQPGDASKGEHLFKSVGCMACHSIGEGVDKQVGGTFAANLQRVGEKADFGYVVRWIHNPRERWAPYCPKEKRDLTREDYEKKGLKYEFDTRQHSECPNDGAELQVQNMTAIPNFRLSEQDARDIATYLFSLSRPTRWPDAPYMDDPKLAQQGATYIKQYGCAGCHEIKGFEDEQRIGKELTTEGSTPKERLDFALLTHPAEKGLDPYTGKKTDREGKPVKEWYTHKGFFEHKLADPSVYDRGKEKDWRDHLRMPQPYLTDEWRSALVTFLLGSVGQEGANVPAALFYNATDRRKDVQDGWWVIKKYNCMGCHTVQAGQKSVLASLPQYLTEPSGPDDKLNLGKEQLPPALTTEGARVDPNWLLRFLSDPSLSGAGIGEELTAGAHGGGPPNAAGQRGGAGGRPAANGNVQGGKNGGAGGGEKLGPQQGANRNGVRTYLRARMPTFNFSPNELRTLVRFFLAVSAQQEPYVKEPLEALSDQERMLARELFTSNAAPCLKCHLTGNAEHDRTASAPNFLQAGERLKFGWTVRWLHDPQSIMPGTAMPSGLFRREGDRWVASFDVSDNFKDYRGDHSELLTRYMLQLTPEEQSRIASAAPAATGGRTTTGQPPPRPPAGTSTHHSRAAARAKSRGRYRQQASRGRARAPARATAKSAFMSRLPEGFSP